MQKIKYSKNTLCLCCGNKLKKVINLPKFPVTEFYIPSSEKVNNNYLVNQAYLFCNNCKHMTIGKTLDPNFIYSNYTTISSQSRGAFECLKNFYKFFKKDKINILKANIIDVGGNDSSFLEFFKAKKKINIDPNASTKDKKVKIYRTFFDKVDFFKFNSNSSNIFFSSHTLEHLAKPQDLIKNIAINMKNKDRLYLQFPSLERLILMKRFDQLCHQHLNFFSIVSINKLLNLNNLYINRYEYDDSHFGTLRVLATRKKNKIKITKVNINFRVIIKNFKYFFTKCKTFNTIKLNDIKNYQGFGAGILTPVLSYFLPNLKKLKYIYDDNSKKFKTKFITMNPIIENPKFIKKNKKIIVTSTSTNFAPRDIIRRLSKLGYGQIVLPPTFNIKYF
jgi:hypothetical protein